MVMPERDDEYRLLVLAFDQAVEGWYRAGWEAAMRQQNVPDDQRVEPPPFYHYRPDDGIPGDE